MFDPFPSPCVGVCKLDEAGSLCLGCNRTLTEIAQWGSATALRKQEILKAVAIRGASEHQKQAAPVDGSSDAAVNRSKS